MTMRITTGATAKLGLPALCLALSGCGSMYYAPKDGGPQAQLTITNHSKMGRASGAIYKTLNCSDAGKSLGFNLIYVGKGETYPIDAGQPLTFLVHGDRGSEISAIKFNYVYCLGTATFAPQPGGRYEAVFKDDGTHCGVEVFDIGSGARQPVAFERRQFRTPYKVGEENCPVVR